MKWCDVLSICCERWLILGFSTVPTPISSGRFIFRYSWNHFNSILVKYCWWCLSWSLSFDTPSTASDLSTHSLVAFLVHVLIVSSAVTTSHFPSPRKKLIYPKIDSYQIFRMIFHHKLSPQSPILYLHLLCPILLRQSI